MITKIKIHGYRIFRDFEWTPKPKMNLIVGGNEAGKSTLIEAIALALTGRINGRSATEELNPYWFNSEVVEEFVTAIKAGKAAAMPEILIEIYLADTDELQQYCGAINTAIPTMACPGVSIKITPNKEYQNEIDAWRKESSTVLPVEYYSIDWRSFADERLTARQKLLTTAVIDSRTIRSSSGVDAHMRQILNDYLTAPERAKVSLAFRKVKDEMSAGPLQDVNNRMTGTEETIQNQKITLAMDQSSRTSWEGVVTPHVNNIPFALTGQGAQAAVKIALAMDKHSTVTRYVTIEEPENHQSHTSLTKLLSRITETAGENQQLFVTTHSAYVLNRLGLDGLLLIEGGKAAKITQLSPETVNYFRKLPGYDTLRMILAEKVVLVEGPSDEIVFQRFFFDRFKKSPMECGIDVISMRGLSFAPCLELCASLDKPVAALRDNDGNTVIDLEQPLSKYLKAGRRTLHVSDPAYGPTLEPQLRHVNKEDALRKALNLTDKATLATWMDREKTEGAIRIATAAESITPPQYMINAAGAING